MFAGRPATEILFRDENAGAAVTRLIQNEIGNFLPRCFPAPVMEKKLSEAGALNSLEKLLGDDLIGIDVRPVQRGDQTGVSAKGLQRDQ